MLLNRASSGRQGSRTQPVNQAQHMGEQIMPHCDPGQLERQIAPMVNYLRADLDQRLPLRGQRSVLELLGVIQCRLLATSRHAVVRN